MTDVTNVNKNIKSIFNRKVQALYALSLYYSSLALNYFRSVQPPTPNQAGKFWTNRTGQAALRVFSDAEITAQFISWFMAHGVQYGVYLELANDRKHESIRPIIQRYVERFLQDAQKIFKD